LRWPRRRCAKKTLGFLLGTHNSYTEVASECGIPAFLLYTSVIALTLVSTFRYSENAHLAEFGDLNALAFCTFNAMLVYRYRDVLLPYCIQRIFAGHRRHERRTAVGVGSGVVARRALAVKPFCRKRFLASRSERVVTEPRT